MQEYINDLEQSIREKNIDILKLLGVDTSNLRPSVKHPFIIENKSGEWVYEFSEYTGDIRPIHGATVTPQMEQYNKEKLAEIGIEI